MQTAGGLLNFFLTEYANDDRGTRMTRAEFVGIMRKIHSGEKRALEKLYTEYYERLCSTAMTIVHNREDAADIASEVFIKLINFQGDPETIIHHVAYLIRMTKNTALNFLQKRKRELPFADLPVLVREPTDSLWKEDVFRLLSPTDWELFVRRVLWRESLKDAARELGMNYATAKRHYAAIKEKLRNDYQK